MKEDILSSLENPKRLEALYRQDKIAFKKAFNAVYPDLQAQTTAQIWHERLNFKQENVSLENRSEFIFVIVLSFIAGLIAKIPDFVSMDQEFFYPRNIGFIVFPALTAYFAWKQNLQPRIQLILAGVFALCVIYINVLPHNITSDTLMLACIHLPLFLWTILGFAFVGGVFNDPSKRLGFLRYNGDLVVMTTLILISGMLLTAITFGLFELIDVKIQDFYAQHIIVWGLAAAPIVGTYLVQTNPQLVNKVSPVIAKIFTPLVFVMLVIYLIAIVATGKDPYNDREFLLVFNGLLIGVMALILFSIAETVNHSNPKMGVLLLLGLSIVTIIINGIALSAILFRISAWGITPNRLAVLGGNVLMLVNLLLVAWRLSKAFKNTDEIDQVEKSIAEFLPIYGLWTILVTFLFPLIFGFK